MRIWFNVLLSFLISTSAFAGNTYVNSNLSNSIASTQNTFTVAQTFSSKLINTAQTATIADSGDGSPATLTLQPTKNNIELTCSDADGCNITMDETNAVDGNTVRIVNVSANVCNFADTSGVTELAGAFAEGQWDAITLEYIVDRWVEISRSNN